MIWERSATARINTVQTASRSSVWPSVRLGAGSLGNRANCACDTCGLSASMAAIARSFSSLFSAGKPSRLVSDLRNVPARVMHRLLAAGHGEGGSSTPFFRAQATIHSNSSRSASGTPDVVSRTMRSTSLRMLWINAA